MGLTTHSFSHGSIEEQIELLELGMARVVAEFRAQAEEAMSLSHGDSHRISSMIYPLVN